jgi:hypothetical protein
MDTMALDRMLATLANISEVENPDYLEGDLSVQ